MEKMQKILQTDDITDTQVFRKGKRKRTETMDSENANSDMDKGQVGFSDIFVQFYHLLFLLLFYSFNSSFSQGVKLHAFLMMSISLRNMLKNLSNNG